jgi:alpha-glucosidase
MPTDLVLKVFTDSQASNFTLWEDDGETVAFYDTASRRPVYDRRRTQITQATGADGSGVTVRIAPAVGSYDGAVTIRNNEVRLITDRRRAMRVVVNGVEVPMRPSLPAFEADDRGFVNLGGNEVRIKTGPMPVGAEKAIEADLASGG